MFLQYNHLSLLVLAVLVANLDAAEPPSVIQGRNWKSVELDERQLARAERVTRKWLNTD